MRSDLITSLCLAAYLPMVLALHAGWYRMNPKLKEGPAQGPAIQCVGLAAAAILAVLALVLPPDGEWLSHLIFAGLALASLGTFYFSFLCVSESGRRYYLLVLLANSGAGLSKDELARLYGKDYMIDVRLSRLLAWGVVEEAQGKLILRKWSFYAYSSFFCAWARLLGYRWLEDPR
jgi:hypothetical protein